MEVSQPAIGNVIALAVLARAIAVDVERLDLFVVRFLHIAIVDRRAIRRQYDVFGYFLSLGAAKSRRLACRVHMLTLKIPFQLLLYLSEIFS